MTVKRFLVLLIVFILSIIGLGVELLGNDLINRELSYSFSFDNYGYFYENEAKGKKEHKKALKSSKQPTDYFIGMYLGYSFTGENNASEYVKDFQSTNFLVFVFNVKTTDLKKYYFALFDADIKIMTNRKKIEYIGYTNNRYRFCMVVDISKADLLQNKIPRFVGIDLNNNTYVIQLDTLKIFGDFQRYIKQLEREEYDKRQEEAVYKNSDEYKQLQLQKLLNELNKNKIYDIEKDNFDNRIHVTSKRTSGKLDNNVINILNKNNLYIVPRCEINTEYGYLDFGMTITQKANLTRGSVYIKGISFSNGSESITIRTGNYGVGQVGKVININGLLDGVQMTCRLDDGYVDDLYNILINAKKPVMVRVHAGEYTYDTVILDLEKNMFIDILKIKQLKDGVKN